jgi:hypothetical protein
VFENRVLWKIFGTKGDEATGEWRKLHNDLHYDLCCSANTFLAITSKGMRRPRHVARVAEKRSA